MKFQSFENKKIPVIIFLSCLFLTVVSYSLSSLYYDMDSEYLKVSEFGKNHPFEKIRVIAIFGLTVAFKKVMMILCIPILFSVYLFIYKEDADVKLDFKMRKLYFLKKNLFQPSIGSNGNQNVLKKEESPIKEHEIRKTNLNKSVNKFNKLTFMLVYIVSIIYSFIILTYLNTNFTEIEKYQIANEIIGKRTEIINEFLQEKNSSEITFGQKINKMFFPFTQISNFKKNTFIYNLLGSSSKSTITDAEASIIKNYLEKDNEFNLLKNFDLENSPKVFDYFPIGSLISILLILGVLFYGKIRHMLVAFLLMVALLFFSSSLLFYQMNLNKEKAIQLRIKEIQKRYS